MNRSELKTLAQKWQTFWQGKDLQDFEKVHAPHFVDHSASGRKNNREAYKQGIIDLYSVFPDFYGTAEAMVIDEAEQAVSMQWTAIGTHQGQFMGIAPTQRRINFTGIEIIKIAGGQIIERWGEWNGIEIMQQLGKLDL